MLLLFAEKSNCCLFYFSLALQEIFENYHVRRIIRAVYTYVRRTHSFKFSWTDQKNRQYNTFERP